MVLSRFWLLQGSLYFLRAVYHHVLVPKKAVSDSFAYQAFMAVQ